MDSLDALPNPRWKREVRPGHHLEDSGVVGDPGLVSLGTVGRRHVAFGVDDHELG